MDEPILDSYGTDLTALIERRHLDLNVRKLQRFWRYTRRYQRVAFLRWRAG